MEDLYIGNTGNLIAKISYKQRLIKLRLSYYPHLLDEGEFFISSWITENCKEFISKNTTIQIDDSIYWHDDLTKVFQALSYYLSQYQETKILIKFSLNKKELEEDIEFFKEMIKDFGFDLKTVLK